MGQECSVGGISTYLVYYAVLADEPSLLADVPRGELRSLPFLL